MFRRFVSICGLLLTQSAFATTYYVDGDSGNDNNMGTSENAAWASISRVNSQNFQPGDIILLRRGTQYSGQLSLDEQGSQNAPITVSAYGTGADPILPSATLSGAWLILEELEFDQGGGSADVVRIRGGDNFILRDLVVHNATRDGIDVVGANNLRLENLHIFDLLAGSFTDQLDAHGIALSDAHDVVITDVNIHHVSGDSVQVDPNRTAGSISSNITIANSELWTGPLPATFNSGWQQGQIPGENALDTKVVKENWDAEPRMVITIQNVTAYGWAAGTYINNRAAFNLKEKVEVVIDGVTVYDSEIAFRLRGNRGNANVSITNAVVHSVDFAFRTESDLENLFVNHVTIGRDVGNPLHRVDSGSSLPGWNWENTVSISSDNDFSGLGVTLAQLSDFRDAANHDYRLTTQSQLVDAGNTSNANTDLLGTPRDSNPDLGAYELALSGIPKPPVILTASN